MGAKNRSIVVENCPMEDGIMETGAEENTGKEIHILAGGSTDESFKGTRFLKSDIQNIFEKNKTRAKIKSKHKGMEL